MFEQINSQSINNQHTCDDVAKFYSNWPRELGDLALKKETAVKQRPRFTNVWET